MTAYNDGFMINIDSAIFLILLLAKLEINQLSVICNYRLKSIH